MKKLLLSLIAIIYSLTAIGQTPTQEPQYINDYLLPPSLTNGCFQLTNPTSDQDYFGLTNIRNMIGLAQPYFIDSTISVKGIAAWMRIGQPQISNYINNYINNNGQPLYIEIKDSTLNNTFARIRYDTLVNTNYYYYYNYHAFFYIEVLFDSTKFISDHKFYIVANFPNSPLISGDISLSAIADHSSNPLCHNDNPPLILYDKEEWIPMPEDTFVSQYDPIDLCLFPILGTVESSLSTIQLEKFTYVYPNPASKDITFASSVGLTKVEVFNLLGQKIYEHYIKANSITIDVSTFVKGNYIAKLFTEKGIATKRFVVE